VPSDVTGHRQHILQVGRAILAGRRANGYEIYIGFGDGIG
jgi:hypothetical protein